MQIIRIADSKADISVSVEELTILCNGLNEACNALDQWDFQTRMGFEREDVLALMKQVTAALDKFPKA